MGISYAKKEFHRLDAEVFFLKRSMYIGTFESSCCDQFLRCGNGSETGEDFISMELMEESLFKLIKK